MFVLVCAVVWLNQFGLPDFLKPRLVENLRTHGIELEFSRLRLHFVRGLVAENVLIGGAKTPDSPTLSLREVQLQLDHRALLHCRLQIDGLVLRQGKFVWPLSPTNALTLDHIQTDLRFQTNDTWSLDNFQADFAGTKLELSGDIAHAPAIRHWEIFHGRQSAGFMVWQARLRKFSDTLAQIHFESAPQLSVTVNGDARDIHSCADSSECRRVRRANIRGSARMTFNSSEPSWRPPTRRQIPIRHGVGGRTLNRFVSIGTRGWRI